MCQCTEPPRKWDGRINSTAVISCDREQPPKLMTIYSNPRFDANHSIHHIIKDNWESDSVNCLLMAQHILRHRPPRTMQKTPTQMKKTRETGKI